MGKKRAFVRYSKQGKVVPGSLILTAGSYPQGPSLWKEVPADLCCANHTISFNLRTGECQNGFHLGAAQAFPWNTGYIYMEYGCFAMDPNTDWGYIYIPGNPQNIYELASILNNRGSFLGTWEVSRDGETLILNTSPDVASDMCPNYLVDSLVFGVYNND
jgi:hypothetical protein